jgi:hypothetical protein
VPVVVQELGRDRLVESISRFSRRRHVDDGKRVLDNLWDELLDGVLWRSEGGVRDDKEKEEKGRRTETKRSACLMKLQR